MARLITIDQFASSIHDILEKYGDEINENMEEAVAALVALGFQKAASVKVVEKLMKEDASMAVGKIVKRALSMM